MYHGHRFRSRLEARWAVYFDHCGIKWDYEPEGYYLDGLCYLPDFWLPQVQMFAEVKPVEFTEPEMEKARRLAEASGHPVLRLVGSPEDRAYLACEPTVYARTHTDGDCDYYVSPYRNYHVDEGRFYCCTDGTPSYEAHTIAAIDAARSARFGT